MKKFCLFVLLFVVSPVFSVSASTSQCLTIPRAVYQNLYQKRMEQLLLELKQTEDEVFVQAILNQKYWPVFIFKKNYKYFILNRLIGLQSSLKSEALKIVLNNYREIPLSGDKYSKRFLDYFSSYLMSEKLERAFRFGSQGAFEIYLNTLNIFSQALGERAHSEIQRKTAFKAVYDSLLLLEESEDVKTLSLLGSVPNGRSIQGQSDLDLRKDFYSSKTTRMEQFISNKVSSWFDPRVDFMSSAPHEFDLQSNLFILDFVLIGQEVKVYLVRNTMRSFQSEENVLRGDTLPVEGVAERVEVTQSFLHYINSN